MLSSKTVVPMTSAPILENALLGELYDMPWTFRRGSKAITAQVERETGMTAEAAFLEYYRMRNGQSGRLLNAMVPDDSIGTETVVGAAARTFPDYLCLTPDKPAALATRALRKFRAAPVELCSLSGDLAVSLNYDVPVVAKKTSGDTFETYGKIASPLYKILNIRGGQNILNCNQIEVPRIYFINDHYGGNNYAHWLLDWVPRLKFLVENKALDKHALVFGMPLNAAQRETLKALNIDDSRVIAVRKATLNASVVFSASEVVGCTTSGAALRRPAQACSRWALNFIRSLFLSGEARGPGRRILVDRRGTRRLLLSNETRGLLERLGFEEVFLEGMPVRDQARLFNDCEMIISAHGAALSNLVFCEPGTKVLEIFPEKYSTSNFFALSSAQSLDYVCAVGTSIKSPIGDHLRDYDIEVDHDIIERFLGHFDIDR